MGIFTYIDTSVSSVLTEAIKVTQTNLANSVTSLITVSITLYVAVYGYMILADKIQSPFKSIMWKLVSFAVILAFIQNSGGILTLAGQAVEELSTIGSNGQAGVGFLDDQYERMSMLADKMSSKAEFGTGWFVNGLILLAYILMAVPIFSILIICKFTMFFLLGIAPLFLFCLMWGWLKDSFSQYATALVSNALIVIVARTMQKSLFEFFEKLTSLDDMNVYMLAFMFVIIAWFSKDFLFYIIGVVGKLSRVTADSFPTSLNPHGARAQAQKEARMAQQQAQRDEVQQKILQQLQILNKNK
ncbi:TriE protein [Pasteurella multocida]|uniref:type IV secretion system protein n=1 Tax=Pasteurella multocida TaxID=747 RepID=UPI000CE7B1D0|nr:type IV secretion system protein [Pasteurella multocida]PPE94937.1 TriE protein [Pasteurella multocida]PPE95030.1 TriE protein [Pasteurella multocida]HDR1236514.1 type IV secretion system protein [Pasteurella multocida]HDR1500983.1 type IV secretion system protein [Pasteurella multocida]